ncbi:NAD(P)H-binding protein [Nocardioidaceae bacterium]|nr:NAD(P)H-binding protein [Nocardioidaceae bacterium]
MPTHDPKTVLVTGATGYVGSRLVPALLEAGHRVVAASRSGTEDYPWDDGVETREFDIADEDLIASAIEGVDVVVYLVHSMDDEDFVRKDREAAERVARACEAAGVTRVVYLSGLVPDGELSDHLRSRLEVEEVFLDSPVPAVVLRAAMVIGSGSTSYELLRRLSERIPLLTPVPRWMDNKIQPVAVEDVVHLIEYAIASTAADGHFDVGGDEVLSYRDLLATFAVVAGLRRRTVLVPGLSAKLVGRACAAISGLEKIEVTALVASLRHDMVCGENTVRGELIDDDFTFTGVAEALCRSLTTGGAEGTSKRGDVQSSASTDPS